MESKETIIISKAEYDSLKSQISILEHQLSELKRMIFGSKRERFIPINDNQTSLFEFPVETLPEKATEKISYERKKTDAEKNNPVRTELPAHLTRVDEIIEPKGLAEGAIKIGETITEILEINISKPYVRRIIRPKYITSQTDEKTTIVIADMPLLPIPKGNAGPSILAHILVSKYVDHLPFYRQRQMLKRQDVVIAESTINGWFAASCKLLEPLYQVMIAKLKDTDYLQADETPMPVLTKDKPGSTHKGYFWVYNDPINKLAVFKYEKTRGREGPDEFLEDFSGYLQTDGYTAYNNLKKPIKITQLACMAHARRKFEHAKDNDLAKSNYAMKMFAQLYDIERQLSEEQANFDEVKRVREEKSVPILNLMKQWLDEQIYQVTPKSAIGMAMAYTLKLWPRLIRFVENGRFNIDNNLIENSIRPVALGRKNYLFAGSHEAAQHAAIIYSLLACCKLNQINPFDYLNQTIAKIPSFPQNRLHELLPQNFGM